MTMTVLAIWELLRSKSRAGARLAWLPRANIGSSMLLAGLAAVTLLGCSGEQGAAPATTGPTEQASQALAKLDDDFNRPSDAPDWKRLHAVEGWADQLKTVNAHQMSVASLFIEPYISGWQDDFHGPFLFKEVSGDFVVTARMKALGKESSVPLTPWSLTGLMVRQPRKTTRSSWTPGGENWILFTTGIGEQLGQPILATRSTTNSQTTSQDVPARAGWLLMRIARVGPSFILVYRYDHPNEPWIVHARFNREDLSDPLQVGLTAFTNQQAAERYLKDPFLFNTTAVKEGEIGLYSVVDWIRFRYPGLPPGLAGKQLSDTGVTDEALLEFLGDPVLPAPPPPSPPPPKKEDKGAES